MRNQLKLFMVVGLLALMLPLLFGVLGPVGASNSEIVAQHENSKNLTNATCSGCHDPNEIDPNDSVNAGVHRRHFVSAFLNFYGDPATSTGCGDCHDETVYGGGLGDGLGSGYEGDLSYTDSLVSGETSATSTRSANKTVKASVCESCHGQFLSSLAGHSGTGVSDGCVTAGSCHDGPTTGGDAGTEHAAVGYITADYADSPTFCARCHGELAWFLSEETTQTLP